MKFITPTSVTGSMLVSSNVTETPPSAWSGATTYAAGNTVSTGTAGGIIKVWESVQGTNLNHDPTTDDGTWWRQLGTTYAAWNSGTTYAANDIVLSATTHRVYLSAQAANTNHDPTTDTGSWWIDVGPTNQWAMLDAVVGTVASRATPITVVIDTGIIDSLALLDLSGTDVQVTITDGPGGTTVYNQNHPLPDTADLFDWYDYFFTEISPTATLIVTGLPPYASARMTVTINAATTAQCGTLVIGKLVELGETLAKPQVSIIDYSRKETDQYGATSVVERAYAKKVEARFWMDSGKVDFAARKLAAVRATPVVWIADDRETYESLTAFGFYRDWGIDIVYPNYSEASITIEGLT